MLMRYKKNFLLYLKNIFWYHTKELILLNCNFSTELQFYVFSFIWASELIFSYESWGRPSPPLNMIGRGLLSSLMDFPEYIFIHLRDQSVWNSSDGLVLLDFLRREKTGLSPFLDALASLESDMLLRGNKFFREISHQWFSNIKP